MAWSSVWAVALWLGVANSASPSSFVLCRCDQETICGALIARRAGNVCERNNWCHMLERNFQHGVWRISEEGAKLLCMNFCWQSMAGENQKDSSDKISHEERTIKKQILIFW